MESMILDSISDTEALGAYWARHQPMIHSLYITGELGMGKTTLVRGFLRALGYKGTVKSPTYTIVESYCLEGRTVHHFDLYRIENPGVLEYYGIRDYFLEQATCLIEWPEKGTGILSAPQVDIQLVYNEKGQRLAHVQL